MNKHMNISLCELLYKFRSSTGRIESEDYYYLEKVLLIKSGF